MSAEKREALPRWVTASLVAIQCVMLGIIGSLISRQWDAVIGTQREQARAQQDIALLVHQLDKRLTVLESYRPNKP